MAITEVHRTKIRRYILLEGTVRRRAFDDEEDSINFVYDNMTLLNDETALDVVLGPLESASDTARVAKLESDKVIIQREIDDIQGRP